MFLIFIGTISLPPELVTAAVAPDASSDNPATSNSPGVTGAFPHSVLLVDFIKQIF